MILLLCSFFRDNGFYDESELRQEKMMYLEALRQIAETFKRQLPRSDFFFQSDIVLMIVASYFALSGTMVPETNQDYDKKRG